MRSSSYFVSNTGKKISATITNLQDDTFDNFSQYQFFQDTPGLVTFKFVPCYSTQGHDTQLIHNKLKTKLGQGIIVKIQQVDYMQVHKSGKLVFIDQRL